MRLPQPGWDSSRGLRRPDGSPSDFALQREGDANERILQVKPGTLRAVEAEERAVEAEVPEERAVEMPEAEERAVGAEVLPGV